MALSAYIAQVQSLLNDAGAVVYTTASLTTFINDARSQIAGSAECIRFLGSLNLTAATQSYPFSAIGNLPSGVQGVLDVRKGLVATGGPQEIFNVEWERFFSFYLCGPSASAAGAPTTYSQLPRGVAGTLYLSPVPNGAMVSTWDCVGYPVALVDDSTPEAIPYPWTEAIQYYAAYLAFLNAQRAGDADAMLQRYTLFEGRATQMSTPTALPAQAPGYGGAQRAGQARPITAPAQAAAGGAG